MQSLFSIFLTIPLSGTRTISYHVHDLVRNGPGFYVAGTLLLMLVVLFASSIGEVFNALDSLGEEGKCAPPPSAARALPPPPCAASTVCLLRAGTGRRRSKGKSRRPMHAPAAAVVTPLPQSAQRLPRACLCPAALLCRPRALRAQCSPRRTASRARADRADAAK